MMTKHKLQLLHRYLRYKFGYFAITILSVYVAVFTFVVVNIIQKKLY